MGRLRGADGSWLKSEQDTVGALVRELFGAGMADMADTGTEMHVVYPYDEENMTGWVHQAQTGRRTIPLRAWIGLRTD